MDRQDRSKRVRYVGSRTLTDVLPPNGPSSFGAFAGTADQRVCVVLRGIAPVLGRMPVVVVHGDTVLESALCQLAALYGVPVALAGPLRRNVPIAAYDPLYGLDRKGVMRVLGVDKDAELESRVRDYLFIMETMHSMEGGDALIGTHPYKLALLHKITHLDYERLETEVIRQLPEGVQEELISRMTQPGDQRKVADVVDALETRLGELIHPYALPALTVAQPSCSISSNALAGGLSCIGVPAKDNAVLDQVDAEVRSLLRRGMPLMLVIANTDVAGSPLAKLVLSLQPQDPLIVGLALDRATSLVDPKEGNVASLLATLDTSLVFCCPNAGVASTFAGAFGSYERRILERGRHHSREFFGIFPRLDAGTHERFQDEGNVRPEDLVGKPRIALVAGRQRAVPMVVNCFDVGR